MSVNSDVKIAIKTDDFNKFKNSKPESFHLAFDEFLNHNVLTIYNCTGSIYSEDNCDITLLEFNSVKWDPWKENVETIHDFIRNLDYYEECIVTEEQKIYYECDDNSLEYGDRNIEPVITIRTNDLKNIEQYIEREDPAQKKKSGYHR